MARPSKYNWGAIKEAYEGGFDREEICRKYKLTPKQLSNKINKEKWAVKGTIKLDVMGLSEQVHKTSENITKLHPENQEMAIDIFDTKTQDENLMLNNRKISKMLQSIIVQNRNDITLKNIKNVSGVLKDIESIANPRPDVKIENTNAQQNNQDIVVEIN